MARQRAPVQPGDRGMSETFTETTTTSSANAQLVELYVHVETPAERAMRLSNALVDLLARCWDGEDVAVPTVLSTEIVDALAEYSHMLDCASRVWIGPVNPWLTEGGR